LLICAALGRLPNVEGVWPTLFSAAYRPNERARTPKDTKDTPARLVATMLQPVGHTLTEIRIMIRPVDNPEQDA
jgi:hypothetical protein